MHKSEEPKFIGIPKSDWWPVSLFCLMWFLIVILAYFFISSPIAEILLAWIILGQGLLVKYRAVAKPYPKTVGGSTVSFFMAFAWPYFCHYKKR